ncbi:MAG: 50S ribosomal protein L10 [Minisyncoccia bacterium]
MKTKEKKAKELKNVNELTDKSEAVIFIDISKIPTHFLNKLRQELKSNLGRLVVIKKRLLNIGFKNKNINLDLSTIKNSFGAIFVENLESGIQLFYKFLMNLEKEKIFESLNEKILFGFNFKNQKEVNKKEIILIGNLPPREIALGQLLGMISTPIRSLMYILQEKTKRSQ